MSSRRLRIRWMEFRGKHRTKLFGGLLAFILAVGLAVWYEWTHRYPDVSSLVAQPASSGAVEKPPVQPAPPSQPASAAAPAHEAIASARAAEPPPPAAKPKTAATKKPKPAKQNERSAPGRTLAGEFRWQRFGVAPYAATRTEAMRTRERAFRALALPEPVVTQLMQATEKPGEHIRLVNGDRLSAMLSKGGVVHKNVVVDFIKPPLSGKMEYAAPSEAWQVTWQGKTYEVILPDVCNNWSMRAIAVPPQTVLESGPSGCSEIAFNAPVGGKVRWHVGTNDGPLPPDGCNAERQGDLSWVAWYGQCDWCEPDLAYLGTALGGALVAVPHKFLYPAIEEKQVLRFGSAIRNAVVGICLEYPNGDQTCGVYVRPQDWHGKTRIDIPDGLWRKDRGDCPS